MSEDETTAQGETSEELDDWEERVVERILARLGAAGKGKGKAQPLGGEHIHI